MRVVLSWFTTRAVTSRQAVGYAEHHCLDPCVFRDEVVQLAQRLRVCVLFRLVDDRAVP
jgi:hypothetical protein